MKICERLGSGSAVGERLLFYFERMRADGSHELCTELDRAQRIGPRQSWLMQKSRPKRMTIPTNTA
jgi:hypothetical protein